MRQVCLALILLLAGLSPGTAADTKADKRIAELSKQILENLQEYWPVNATDMGIHAYDDKFTDYSPEAVKKEYERIKGYIQRLHPLLQTALPVDQEIDVKLLNSNCDVALLTLGKLEYHKKNPNIYLDDAANGVYFILKSAQTVVPKQVDNIIARMKALPAFLRQAETNLQSPPQIWLDYALNNIDNVMEFYRVVTSRLSAQFPDRARDLAAASREALAAFDGFRQFLSTAAPGDPKAFAIGKEYYDYLLQHEYFLPYASDSLLRMGEALLAEAQAAYQKRSQEDEAAGYFRRKPIFVPSSLTKKDVLDYYAWEMEAVKQYVADSHIVTIPAGIAPCAVIETPEFLRGVTGSIAYQQAGPFDSAGIGYFYVGVIPDTLTAAQREQYFRSMRDRGFRGGVVHEAYPGRHLQMQLARRHPSPVRRWQMNNLLIEGWALYCEEMMHDAGLYEDNPGRYLRVLGGVKFRAARIIADVKLQTGQFSFDEAVAWMAEAVDADSSLVKAEVLRYTMTPGAAMSYLIGKQAIVSLRDRVKQQEGERFTRQSFHDRLLSEGSIPIGLIEKKLLR